MLSKIQKKYLEDEQFRNKMKQKSLERYFKIRDTEEYKKYNLARARNRLGIPLDRPKGRYNRKPTFGIKFEDRKVIITFD